jgi:hypothetical protein
VQKYKFRVPTCFLWDPHRAHPSMKNSVSTFYATDAP